MKNIVIPGDDGRQRELRRRFGEFSDLSRAEAVILPLPSTVDEAFARKLRPDALVIGGRFDEKSRGLLDGHRVIDYTERADFAQWNALATAEGALAILMDKLEITLDGAKILVVGNGRIGKILARKLKLLGAETAVSARKAADLAEIETAGHFPLETAEIFRAASDFDAVVNTVPAPVLDRRFLEALRPGAFIVDLASAPGGTDFAAAKELGVPALHALALPGKTAPRSAAETAYRSIRNIFSEVENHGT